MELSHKRDSIMFFARIWNKHMWEFYPKKGKAKFVKRKLKIRSSSSAESKNRPHVAWGAYHLIAFRIIVASLYQCTFGHDFTNLRNFALLSARCIYLLLFRKKSKQSLCSRIDFYPSHQNQFVWERWYFSLRTSLLRWKIDSEAWRSSEDSRDRCACVTKRPPLFIFFFFCLLLETA